MYSYTYSIKSGSLAKEQEFPELVSDCGAQKAHFEGLGCIGTVRALTKMLLSVSQAINQNAYSREVCDLQWVFNQLNLQTT
jgi:hypothetical protein